MQPDHKMELMEPPMGLPPKGRPMELMEPYLFLCLMQTVPEDHPMEPLLDHLNHLKTEPKGHLMEPMLPQFQFPVILNKEDKMVKTIKDHLHHKKISLQINAHLNHQRIYKSLEMISHKEVVHKVVHQVQATIHKVNLFLCKTSKLANSREGPRLSGLILAMIKIESSRVATRPIALIRSAREDTNRSPSLPL